MKYAAIVALVGSFALGAVSSAQTAPTTSSKPLKPILKQPTSSPTAIPKPTVPTRLPSAPRPVAQPQTARANTTVTQPKKSFLKSVDGSQITTRITLPGMGTVEKVRIVVERAGACGWTENILDRVVSGERRPRTRTSADVEQLDAQTQACREAHFAFTRYLSSVANTGSGNTASKSMTTAQFEGQGFDKFVNLPAVAVMVYGTEKKFHQLAGSSIFQLRHTDNDSDGHWPLTEGGDDCDDNDPDRFPGNSEIADTEGKDEDCDFSTIGNLDRDGDGYISYQAFNVDARGREQNRGDDCDDTRADVNPGERDEKPGNWDMPGYIPVDNDCNGLADDGS